ncbi:unnamed protein product [Orchesella dallaii]|uniref:Tetraspanin n=1 Tax=Orchesella dallaii TaxID=48710 RepID=A0ABP1RKZ4_9HEXA
MGCGSKMYGYRKCMRYSLFTSNLIILLGGIAAVTVATLKLRDQSYFERLASDSLYKSSCCVLLGMGIATIFLVAVGTFGALKEIKCFLLTFIIALLISFVVLLIGGLLGYVFTAKESTPMKTGMLNTMKKYNKSDSIRETWDTVQVHYQCCGASNHEDWLTVFHGIEKVPPSCCKDLNTVPTCQINAQPQDIWTMGCAYRLKEGGTVVGSVGVTVSCFMIFSLIFSIAVFRSIT